MTDPISPARRRAEAAFSLLTLSSTSSQRAVDDAQSDATERALKTARLRNARLERARFDAGAKTTTKTRRSTLTQGDKP